MMDDQLESTQSSPPYPHDGSEILGTLGPQKYRCTRGNCGAHIGHPSNQDQHNYDAHMPTGDYRTPIWDDVE